MGNKQLPFYSANEAFGEKYYQLPMVFYTSPLYKPMSNDAKVAFAILKSHFSYSVLNHWVDDEDHIFFTYTNDRLMEILGCQKAKLIKVKNELIQAGLLSQVRVGLNRPNRLYLHRPETNADDVYQIAREEQEASAAVLPNSTAAVSLGAQGSSKNELPENAANIGSSIFKLPLSTGKHDPQTLDTTGSSKIEHELDLDSSSRDLPRDLSETAKSDSSIPSLSPSQAKQDPEQDPDLDCMLLNNFADSIDPTVCGTVLSRSSLQLIGKWSHTVKEAKERVGIVLNAKRDSELEYDTYLVTEDLQDDLDKALLRVVMRWKDQLDGRSERSIRNINNYLYGAMKQVFENASLAQLTMSAKTDEQRKALRELQDNFADAKHGKKARQNARERNLLIRKRREQGV